MTSSQALTLSASGLTRKYGNNIAAKNVSIDLYKGQIVGLLGPNGAGKSTTMKMITGNLAPSEGGVQICGIDLIEKPLDAKAKIGYLPEIPPVYKELRVDEYLTLAARLHRVASKKVSEAVNKAEERVGVTHMRRRLIGSLSKGYQQRVGIAQAIIHEPEVIILDEPTVGLDPNQILEIRDLIRQLGNEHSVILSTHILQEVEAICDRVQILHHGSVVFNDAISGLRQFRAGKTIQAGFRTPPDLVELQTALPDTVCSIVRNGVFRIQASSSEDPTSTIVRKSVECSWNLYELSGAQASVEEVFAELTKQSS
ncbi:MAG: ABC transporter ATP-binding protein [Burkholderiales bacterium]